MSDKYVEFFLNSRASVVQFETFELFHPSFSKTYYIVRNNVNGITVKLENGNTVTFEYYPVQFVPNTTQDDLDYSLRLEFGDLGEILPKELDAVKNADTFIQKPVFKFRAYRSDFLESPMLGPIELEVVEFTFNNKGASFEARSPQLNLHKTGEIYTIDRFPMLAGFL